MNLETIYDDYLERLQEERKEKYKEYEEWFSGSSAGSCYKKQWYKVNGFEPEPFDLRTKRLLRLGTIVHKDIENAISEAEPAEGVTVYLEHEIKLPELNVVGHLDHCLVRKDGDTVELYISDLKTIASYSWTLKFGREAKKKSINKTNWMKTNKAIMVNKNPIRMFFAPIEAILSGNIAHTKNLMNYYSGKKKQTQRAEKRKLKNTIKNVSDNL